jgi:CPA2 family monovalent cation:H+ antiporter-2
MLKQLSDQNELDQEHGRLALGISLFQDLAALPLLIVIDGLSDRADPGGASGALVPVVGAVVFFVSITVLARHILARFIEWIASTRSAELFLLAVLAIILGAAAVAGAIGLSLPIGAFLVGMVIGESDFRHQVSAEVRPFRDVLLGLFFLTVGMQIDLFVLVEAPLLVLMTLVGVIGVKTLIVATVVRASGWDLESGLRAGLVVAPGGEFALLIATQAMAEGLLGVSVGQVVLAATAVSMLMAPFILQRNGLLAGRLPKPVVTADGSNGELSAESDGHVILCGCGRVAGLVALALQASGKSVLAIEHDLVRLRRAKSAGLLVVYGDATREAILKVAGVDRAGAIVVTFSRRNDVELLVRRIRLSRPRLPVIVSTPDSGDMTSLVKAGATHVLPESLAAGLGLAARTLVVLGVPPHEVEAHMAAVRCRMNPELTEASEPGTDTWRQKA